LLLNESNSYPGTTMPVYTRNLCPRIAVVHTLFAPVTGLIGLAQDSTVSISRGSPPPKLR
jgi:hypothetical protein